LFCFYYFDLSLTFVSEKLQIFVNLRGSVNRTGIIDINDDYGLPRT
jgi:hypothetical protein